MFKAHQLTPYRAEFSWCAVEQQPCDQRSDQGRLNGVGAIWFVSVLICGKCLCSCLSWHPGRLATGDQHPYPFCTPMSPESRLPTPDSRLDRNRDRQPARVELLVDRACPRTSSSRQPSGWGSSASSSRASGSPSCCWGTSSCRSRPRTRIRQIFRLFEVMGAVSLAVSLGLFWYAHTPTAPAAIPVSCSTSAWSTRSWSRSPSAWATGRTTCPWGSPG